MAATTAFSSSVAAASSSCSKTPKQASKPLATNLGFISWSSSKATVKSLRGRVLPCDGAASKSGSALGARMVSTPELKPQTTLDFQTSVFTKEKISLAGQDERVARVGLVPKTNLDPPLQVLLWSTGG